MRQMRPPTECSRRDLVLAGSCGILFGAAGLVPRGAARADALAMQARMDEILDGRVPLPGWITLDIPEISENGTTVPVTVAVDGPMGSGEYVRSIHLLAERNPRPGVATFHLTPRSGRAFVAVRIRLAESQRVHALAEVSNGLVFATSREVQVTVNGCGG